MPDARDTFAAGSMALKVRIARGDIKPTGRDARIRAIVDTEAAPAGIPVHRRVGRGP